MSNSTQSSQELNIDYSKNSETRALTDSEIQMFREWENEKNQKGFKPISHTEAKKQISWLDKPKLKSSTPSIADYNKDQTQGDKQICELLMTQINQSLSKATSKIWHRSPVWFLDGNPIVGYNKQKAGIKLMFWSGVDFGDDRLKNSTGKFKDAGIFYNSIQEINLEDIHSWLIKSQAIQWDYKNIVKRKGVLVKLRTNL